MNERIKKLRKTLGLTQQEFADRLGTTRNNIAGYEIDRRSPSSSVISLICREFGVSEEWLRTGEGEMFAPEAEDAVGRLCTELHADELETEIIRAYFRIDEKIRLPFLRQLIQEVQSAQLKANWTEADTTIQERTRADRPLTVEEEVEEEVNQFRQQLLLEKKQASQASSAKESDAV